jgi:hypothetical protein
VDAICRGFKTALVNYLQDLHRVGQFKISLSGSLFHFMQLEVKISIWGSDLCIAGTAVG